MARITRVTAEQAPADVAEIIRYTRGSFAQIAGRETENMLEPVEVLAHVPELLKALGGIAQATMRLHGVSTRHHALVSLKAATLTNCEYCIDLGSQIARRSGLSDDELLALPFYRQSGLFDEVDRLVLDYAVGMSRTPVDVPDELFDRLREHFDEAQLVELTHAIALENLYGRFNMALGIGSSGLTEGMVCAVPERVPEAVA